MRLRHTLLCLLTGLVTQKAIAQKEDTTFKRGGTIWGLTFCDFAFKSKADTVGYGLGRGTNQYSKMPADSRLFQMRRVYLGYDYNISRHFSAELVLAAENDMYPGSLGNQPGLGDALQNNRFAPYIKLADIRWKDIFKGSDLVFGSISTPAFSQQVEPVWGYRCIEKTIADLRNTPSFDLGISLQGHFDSNANFGYNLMVGTGHGALAENNQFQWFYGDIWAKLFNKRVIIDLYQDYEKLDWTPAVDTSTDIFHHDRNMTKLMIAYSVPKFTVGIEAFQNTLMADVAVSSIVNGQNKTYYRTVFATAFSIFARGRIYKDKFGFFARYDNFDPSHKLKDVTGVPYVVEYNLSQLSSEQSGYDPTTKEQFVTFGIDYTPFPNIHIMPNFFMNTYTCALDKKDYSLNPRASGAVGSDVAYRLTVYYLFGRKENVRY